jgi:hypothetical protein
MRQDALRDSLRQAQGRQDKTLRKLRASGRYKKGRGVPEPARCRRYETQQQIPRPSKDKRGARAATGSE